MQPKTNFPADQGRLGGQSPHNDTLARYSVVTSTDEIDLELSWRLQHAVRNCERNARELRNPLARSPPSSAAIARADSLVSDIESDSDSEPEPQKDTEEHCDLWKTFDEDHELQKAVHDYCKKDWTEKQEV